MSIGADGSIGEGQPVALTAADHDLDGVAEEPACSGGVAQIARAFQVFPRDLEGVLKRLGKRDGHVRKTNSSRARSISSSPLTRSRNMCSPNGVFHAI